MLPHFPTNAIELIRPRPSSARQPAHCASRVDLVMGKTQRRPQPWIHPRGWGLPPFLVSCNTRPAQFAQVPRANGGPHFITEMMRPRPSSAGQPAHGWRVVMVAYLAPSLKKITALSAGGRSRLTKEGDPKAAPKFDRRPTGGIGVT